MARAAASTNAPSRRRVKRPSPPAGARSCCTGAPTRWWRGSGPAGRWRACTAAMQPRAASGSPTTPRCAPANRPTGIFSVAEVPGQGLHGGRRALCAGRLDPRQRRRHAQRQRSGAASPAIRPAAYRSGVAFCLLEARRADRDRRRAKGERHLAQRRDALDSVRCRRVSRRARLARWYLLRLGEWRAVGAIRRPRAVADSAAEVARRPALPRRQPLFAQPFTRRVAALRLLCSCQARHAALRPRSALSRLRARS